MLTFVACCGVITLWLIGSTIETQLRQVALALLEVRDELRRKKDGGANP